MSRSPATRLTVAERAERNRRIAEARAAGEWWRPIAEREGLSVKQARRCAEDHLRSAARVRPRRLAEIDADALLVRIIDSHERALAAALTLMIAGDNGSVRVGAARSVASIGTSLHTVLLRTGLAGDPGLTRFAREIEVAARVVSSLADRYEIPLEEVDATIECLPTRGLTIPSVTDRGLGALAESAA